MALLAVAVGSWFGCELLATASQSPGDLQRAAELEAGGELEAALASYDLWLGNNPDDVAGLIRRGGVHFKLGDNAAALEDFDRAVVVSPDAAPYLWQRGISLYYAKRWDDCIEQFVSHRTVNPNDVENAAWHFLCVARRDGVKVAQQSLLPVGPDQRVPMAQVYELYRGQVEGEAVEESARSIQLGPLRHRLFYAYLYLALWEEVRGRTAEAKSHLVRAVEQEFPHYMGDVARLHLQWLNAEAAQKQ